MKAAPFAAPTFQEGIGNPATWNGNTKEDLLGASYPVRQAVFSGPLHLLLALLEKNSWISVKST